MRPPRGAVSGRTRVSGNEERGRANGVDLYLEAIVEVVAHPRSGVTFVFFPPLGCSFGYPKLSRPSNLD
jgi:hypothetical protein